MYKKTFDAYSEEVQQKVYLSVPGITGIGSVIFRDEENLISQAKGDPHEFYKNVIAPYKGQLELWYLQKKNFMTDLLILFLTVWVVFFPKSNLPHQIFKGLPPKTFN